MDDLGVIPGHPRSFLYAIFQGTLDDEIASAFERVLSSLSTRRQWVIDAPQLVDYIDELPDQAEGKKEIHTYGCSVQIYRALPPWRAKLPRAVDELHFQEVALLVDELSRFSSQFNCGFVLQLDETHIGYIRCGVPDDSIQIGLLEEWKKNLQS